MFAWLDDNSCHTVIQMSVNVTYLFKKKYLFQFPTFLFLIFATLSKCRVCFCWLYEQNYIFPIQTWYSSPVAVQQSEHSLLLVPELKFGHHARARALAPEIVLGHCSQARVFLSAHCIYFLTSC